MGKRKGGKGSDLAAAAARKRARTTLPSSFRCPFCNMMDVAASLKPDEGRARVSCGACGMGYNTVCRTLTEPVDVYHEWLDACEEGLQEEEAAPPPRRQRARTPEAGDGQAGGRGRGGAYGDEELLMPSPEGGDGLLRPSPVHRLRRGDGSGVRDSGGGGGGVDDAQRQRRRRLAEGLEETRRGGLQAGAALHDPAAGSLLASRTAATPPSGPPLPLPAGSLAAMARRQQQQRAAERERRRAAGEEVEEEQGAGSGGSEMGGSGAEGGVYGPGPALVVHTGRRRGGSIDGSMGSGGSGGGAGAGVAAGGTPTKRQSLAAQQQAAARAFADYDD